MRLRHLCIGLFMTVTTGISFPQEPVDEVAKGRDIYAIYSMMISPRDELVLIEGTTLTSRNGFGSPFRPQAGPGPLPCTQAPQEEAAAFNEVLKDYDLRRDVSVTLRNEFTLDRAYQLLSSDEARAFLEDALRSTPQVVPAGGVPQNRNPLFPRARRVFRVGDVYFNQNRSMAMSYVSVMTTTMDGTGGWKVFKKSAAGQWQEVMYGNPAPGQPIWRSCGWGSAR